MTPIILLMIIMIDQEKYIFKIQAIIETFGS